MCGCVLCAPHAASRFFFFFDSYVHIYYRGDKLCALLRCSVRPVERQDRDKRQRHTCGQTLARVFHFHIYGLILSLCQYRCDNLQSNYLTKARTLTTRVQLNSLSCYTHM